MKRPRKGTVIDRAAYTKLTQLPNIGTACAADLRLLGIRSPAQLVGRDPYAMYESLCRITGQRHDPCVIDVFISAVRFYGRRVCPAVVALHGRAEEETRGPWLATSSVDVALSATRERRQLR